jgi:hypothetical protein
MLSRLRPRLNHATVVAYMALFAALGGGALAATKLVGRNGTIRGCVTKSGKLTVLKVGKKCKKGRKTIAWSRRGPKGPKGDPGPAPADADTLDGLDSSAFVRPGAEGWHDAVYNNGTDTHNPNIHCYWAPYGPPFAPAAYFRDATGIVHLRGFAQMRTGISTSCGDFPDQDYKIFDLPPGYRPEVIGAFAIVSNNTPGRVNTLADGRVMIEPGYPTNGNAMNWVSLDGISFRCAPAGQDGCP